MSESFVAGQAILIGQELIRAQIDEDLPCPIVSEAEAVVQGRVAAVVALVQVRLEAPGEHLTHGRLSALTGGDERGIPHGVPTVGGQVQMRTLKKPFQLPHIALAAGLH